MNSFFINDIVFIYFFCEFTVHTQTTHTYIFHITVIVAIRIGGVVYQSNHFLLCLLSFSFSPYEHNDTDKVFFGASMK